MAEEEKKEEPRAGIFGSQIKSGIEPDKPRKYGIAAEPEQEFQEFVFDNFIAKDSKQRYPEKTVYHLKFTSRVEAAPEDIMPIIELFLNTMINKGCFKIEYISDLGLEFPIALTIIDPEANKKIVDILKAADASLNKQFSW